MTSWGEIEGVFVVAITKKYVLVMHILKALSQPNKVVHQRHSDDESDNDPSSHETDDSGRELHMTLRFLRIFASEACNLSIPCDSLLSVVAAGIRCFKVSLAADWARKLGGHLEHGAVAADVGAERGIRRVEMRHCAVDVLSVQIAHDLYLRAPPHLTRLRCIPTSCSFSADIATCQREDKATPPRRIRRCSSHGIIHLHRGKRQLAPCAKVGVFWEDAAILTRQPSGPHLRIRNLLVLNHLLRDERPSSSCHPPPPRQRKGEGAPPQVDLDTHR
mmetsp:Transcript_21057/g.34082  ORF Transcript_21057/g.34082 Transcript_21057/m.34082 type:complete len:275 (-) Transcript_21057:523-1347(-)